MNSFNIFNTLTKHKYPGSPHEQREDFSTPFLLIERRFDRANDAWLKKSSMRRAGEARFGVRMKSAGEDRYPAKEEIVFR
ncbi:hypothetical protein [Cohnella soli]|uniref:Uncharacterized protein n=1 Tax=Cohnella soli TaxID=425005 RepID=A0ABW0HVT2_9BACL